LTDTGFLVWFFWELDFLQKTYWTVFQDLDGLISDQSTSATKLGEAGKLDNGRIALFKRYGIY
jgi:hypothetical protein